MLTFATHKLSTCANGLMEDAPSFFCQRSFDQAQPFMQPSIGCTLCNVLIMFARIIWYTMNYSVL